MNVVPFFVSNCIEWLSKYKGEDIATILKICYTCLSNEYSPEVHVACIRSMRAVYLKNAKLDPTFTRMSLQLL